MYQYKLGEVYASLVSNTVKAFFVDGSATMVG